MSGPEKSEPLHIGIVACGAEGTALCYRTICNEAPAILGAYRHPEISVHTTSLSIYLERVLREDWPGVAELMLASAEKLARIGADFLICPTNTIHRAFDLVAPRSPLPWLHIVEEVAAEAKREGFHRVALTGTRQTMEGPMYPELLARSGIECSIPPPVERAAVHRIIFEELVKGIFEPESTSVLESIIDGMKSGGCDAVVLGCTELPLVITEANSALPILDSTRLLARAALRRAVRGAEE